MSNASFINEIAPHAQRILKNYNILASIVIAQGCLESGYGTSGLATKGKNLFGIKGTYNGQYVLMWTTEYDKKGNAVRVQAKFRKYPSWYESMQDLAKLYTNGLSWDKDHYKAIVGETDYKKATAALVKAGYATDPSYATKLNSIIETNKLTQYDSIEGLPEDPDEPSQPPVTPTYPSKEYDGIDAEPLNEKLPKDVYFNQMHVSSASGDEVIEITGVSIDLVDDTNGKKEFTFSITRTENNGAEFDLLMTDNILYVDEMKFKKQKYYITDVEIKQENSILTKTIKASHVYLLLINNYVHDTMNKKMTIKQALDFVLKGTKFSYILHGKESNFPTIDQENFGDKNSPELMDQIVDDYEPELDIDNYIIHVYEKMGKEINHTLDSRLNMPGITIKYSSKPCTTRAWGYGALKDNKSTDPKKEPEYVFEPVLYRHPDEKKFLIDGMPREADPIRDERCKKASSIISQLKKHVNPYPEITVEVDYQYVYDEKILKIQENFWKGDTLHILADTGYGITYEGDVRLLSIQYDPLNPYSSPKLTFANYRKNIMDIQLSYAKKIRDVKRYFDDMRLVDFSAS
ncbi:phage tail protein [Bacillus sp. H1F1]|uniref:phage tail protein n=1 Tax=Bacillus sp. H1F1 TaxID=2994530 RepID=UPI00224B844F|nr:phage tail protein [Bacillus sp. H1F1]MCX2823347.1 phage tail protein [Bacillus sp. H1F1]